MLTDYCCACTNDCLGEAPVQRDKQNNLQQKSLAEPGDVAWMDVFI